MSDNKFFPVKAPRGIHTRDPTQRTRFAKTRFVRTRFVRTRFARMALILKIKDPLREEHIRGTHEEEIEDDGEDKPCSSHEVE